MNDDEAHLTSMQPTWRWSGTLLPDSGDGPSQPQLEIEICVETGNGHAKSTWNGLTLRGRNKSTVMLKALG